MRLKFNAVIAVIFAITLLCLGTAWAETKPEITLQPSDMTVNCRQIFSLDGGPMEAI